MSEGLAVAAGSFGDCDLDRFGRYVCVNCKGNHGRADRVGEVAFPSPVCTDIDEPGIGTQYGDDGWVAIEEANVGDHTDASTEGFRRFSIDFSPNLREVGFDIGSYRACGITCHRAAGFGVVQHLKVEPAFHQGQLLRTAARCDECEGKEQPYEAMSPSSTERDFSGGHNLRAYVK